MTVDDATDFAEQFNTLRLMFPYRGSNEEIQKVSQQYFNALRRHSLADVTRAIETWMQTGARFPKVKDLLSSLPRKDAIDNIPEMTAAEAKEHDDAAALFYEGEPCNCVSCVNAGVSHRFLRWVNETDADDRDIRARIGTRVVCRGRWVHGMDLFRYYAERDKFFSEAQAKGFWTPSLPDEPTTLSPLRFMEMGTSEHFASTVHQCGSCGERINVGDRYHRINIGKGLLRCVECRARDLALHDRGVQDGERVDPAVRADADSQLRDDLARYDEF
jgi:hypothetical protein